MELSFNEIAGIITVVIISLGFVFTWGWRVIQSVKSSAHKRIDAAEEKIKTVENNHTDFEKKVISRLDDIKEGLSKKPDRQTVFEYTDKTFVRKDVHSVEYTNLITKIAELDHKLDQLKKTG